MQRRELTPGRTFGVVFEHGDDFFDTIKRFCAETGVRQAYIPMFLAGFAEAELAGTCERVGDPKAPVWSPVYLENLEALGCGSIAYDEASGEVVPHIHAAVGMRHHGATGHTSHLLRAQVQFVTEMLIVEIVAPPMRRVVHQSLYNVSLLSFA